MPKSMFEEVNTRSNLPAQIDLFAEGEDAYKFLFVAKGGGSANRSFLFQATPSILTPDRLLKFLEEKMRTLGTSACPPYHPVLIARRIARHRLPLPAPAATGHKFLDLAARLVHHGLYALVFLMVISGISLSLQAGLLPIVFGGSSAALPSDFFVYNARRLHGLVAPALLVLVVLHAGATLIHELLIKDRLMARMWFRKRRAMEQESQEGMQQ